MVMSIVQIIVGIMETSNETLDIVLIAGNRPKIIKVSELV
jgi:hypothetical protein